MSEWGLGEGEDSRSHWYSCFKTQAVIPACLLQVAMQELQAQVGNLQEDTDVEGQRGFEDGPMPRCSALGRKAEEHSLGREVMGGDSELYLFSQRHQELAM